MRAHPLVRAALAFCPRDYRREYEESIAADMRSRKAGALAVAVDLLVQGVSMHCESLWRDLTFAARTLRKSPMYAIVAISAIALAIACNVAVGSVLDGVLLKPLPYPNAQRLVQVGFDTYGQISYLDSRDLRAGQRTLESFGIRGDASATLTGISHPVTLNGSDVDEYYLRVLGTAPLLGRTFGATDLGRREAIISNAVWRTYFQADPNAVGREIRLDDKDYRIIGVMPSGFRDITQQGPLKNDYWIPFDPQSSAAKARGYTMFYGWAVLRPGVSLDAARSDVLRVDRGIVQRYPANHIDWKSGSVAGALDLIVGPVRQMIWLMYAGALILLIIACANVINLTLVRAQARERELVMRTALGASNGRVAAQLVTEMGLLATLAGIIGIALGWAALRGFDVLGAAMIPRWENVHVDGTVVGYVCGLLFLTSIVTGGAPAFAKRRDLHSAVKAAGRSGDLSGGKRLRVAMVVAEIALTLGLISAAGLTLRSFYALTHVAVGFDARRLYGIVLPSLPKAAYPTYDAKMAMLDRLTGAVRTIPGVEDAAASAVAPMEGELVIPTAIPGRAQSAQVDGNIVGPGYFHTLGIPLLRGRDFSPDDGPHSQSVAIVNASFARKFFGTLDVTGRQIKPEASSPETPSMTRTIVGVVGDTRDHLADEMRAGFYLPVRQLPLTQLLVVRAAGSNIPVAQEVKNAFAATAPLLPAPQVDSYDALLRQDAGRWEAGAMLFTALAVVALVLALAGIYAVTAYSVSQRTQEFGVRKAIGASDGHVLRSVLADALRHAGLGIAIGLVLAAVCTRFLAPLLFQTSPFDPLTYAAVVTLIVACSVIAALVPAVRATRVQPATALRYE